METQHQNANAIKDEKALMKKPYAHPKVTVVPLTTEERVSECFLRPFQEACKKLGTKG